MAVGLDLLIAEHCLTSPRGNCYRIHCNVPIKGWATYSFDRNLQGNSSVYWHLLKTWSKIDNENFKFIGARLNFRVLDPDAKFLHGP